MIKKATIISFFLLVFIFTSCDNKSSVWKIFEEEDLLRHPPAKRCGDCHQEIYKQWKNSRHAKAYISEDYKKATNNYSKAKCLNCHIPLELSKAEKPQIRTFNKEDGVNCVSCHFSSETNSMHGPYEVFSPPHPSTKDEDFRKSKVCSSCHIETFKQWKLSGSSKTCQQCHMVPAEKKDLIQKFPFHYFHMAKQVYNHRFKTGKAKPEDIKIQLKKEGTTLVVLLKNVGVPHNLPTADNGKPKLYIEVETYKEDEKLEREVIMLTPKFALEYGKLKNVSIDFFEEFDAVKVNIYRKLSWQKEREKILSLSKKFK